MFTTEDGVKDLAAEVGVEAVSDFATNPHGTPILRSMFKHVEHHSSSRFIGYDADM